MIEDWKTHTKPEWLRTFSKELSVSEASLRALQVCYASEHRAWAIPMSDGYDNMVGIRLRAPGGAKWAVRGSHSGAFIPTTGAQSLALVVEGFSDTAAGLDLGYYAIGRPAASGGVPQLKHLFKMKRVTRAAIVADNDEVGITGAQAFSKHLGVPSCVVVLPVKDVRDFLICGGTRQLLDSIINQSIWTV